MSKAPTPTPPFALDQLRKPQSDKDIPILTVYHCVHTFFTTDHDCSVPVSCEYAYAKTIETLNTVSNDGKKIILPSIKNYVKAANQIITNVHKDVLFGKEVINASAGKCVYIDEKTEEVCGKKAQYAEYIDTKPEMCTHCSEHRFENMVKMNGNKVCRMCHWERATKGYFNGSKSRDKMTKEELDAEQPILCTSCAVVAGYKNMKTTTTKSCGIDGCDKIKTHGKPGTKKAIMCGVHGKLKGYIDVVSKKCCVCKTAVPHYTISEDKPATHCKACADKLELNVIRKDRMCEECGKKSPHYGHPGEYATYCKACSVNIEGIERLDSLCKHESDDGKKCNTIAKYNHPNEKGCKYCAEHAYEGMVHKSSKQCEDEKCIRTAMYNFPGQKKGYCVC